LPCVDATNAVHPRQDSRSDQRTESATEQRGRVEDGHAKIELALCVPLREIEQHACEERSLDDAQNEAACHYASETFDLACQQGDKPPSCCEEPEVQRRPANIIHHGIRGHLHEDVADEQD